MKKQKNGMAISGFVLTMSSVLMFAAALLCLIRVMLIPFLAVIFGEMACLVALFGVVLSAIGTFRSYREDMGGAGLSLAGLIIGTMVITLVLAIVALLIVDGCTTLTLPKLL